MNKTWRQPLTSPVAPATTFAWPDGHRIAVMVTVLLENWSDRKAPSYSPMTTPLKPGAYDRAGVTWSQYGGKAGVWRLLRILQRREIAATVCANVKSIEMHLPAIKAYLDAGHEIAAHSYTQDKVLAYMDREEERSTIRDCARIFAELLGHRPAGWLSPVIASTDDTADLLCEEGFLWHGDYNDADLPGIVRTNHGSIVSLPHTDFADNRVLRQSPQTYFDAYKSTFDYLYREEPNSLINLTIHCQFGGRPLVAAMFDQILGYFQQFPGVWFVRHDELATWFRTLGVDQVGYADRFFTPGSEG